MTPSRLKTPDLSNAPKRWRRPSNSQRLKLFLKSSLCAFALNAAFVSGTTADVGSDLSDFWSRAGGAVNVTRPQTYDGQRAGFATLGSLYVRTANRNSALINIQLPSIRAGCGGIDLFGGSFSFISKEEMIQLMRGIMQNAAGFAFELALKSMSPAVQDIVAELRAIIERVNAMNIDSCETAQGLVSSIWPKVDGASQHICKTVGTRQGIFQDWVANRHGCGSGGSNASTLDRANDEQKDQVPVDVNYSWKATKKHLFLSSNRTIAEFFMTLTGTIITTAPATDDEGAQHRKIPPKVGTPEMLRVLIEGGSAEILRCNETEKCLNPTFSTTSIATSSAFYARVEGLIKELAEAIDLDEEPSEEAISLLNLAPQAIWKTLVTAKAYKYNFVDDEIALMSQYVAIEVAMQYLSEGLEEMSSAAGNTDSFGDIGREYQDSIRETQNNFNQFRANAYRRYEEATITLRKLRMAEESLAAHGATAFSSALASSSR